MPKSNAARYAVGAAIAALTFLPVVAGADPQSPAQNREQRLNARRDQRLNREAADLYRTAETTFLVGDLLHAASLYERLLALAPDSNYVVRCHARLGDCAYENRRFTEAVTQYRRAAAAVAADGIPEEISDAIRADFMVGQSYLSAHQYTQAFGNFRRFIDRHAEHPLVNQAYQAIGDAHLALEQYEQALRAYRMVGTVLSRQKSTLRLIAPGDRLYLRVSDADVNISDTPKSVQVTLRTTSGDVEQIELAPLALHSPVFIGTIPTALGNPRHSGDLKAAFSDADGQLIRSNLAEADQLEAQSRQKGEDMGEAGQGADADPAGREKLRSVTMRQIESLSARAKELRQGAMRSVDHGYASVETILAQWAPEQSLSELRRRRKLNEATPQTRPEGLVTDSSDAADRASAPLVETPLIDPDPGASANELEKDRPPGDGGEGTGAVGQTGLTQADIDKLRLEVADAPTTAATVRRRLAALSLWTRALIGEFQVLELSGNDKIEVEYTDEVGPDGPNPPVKARRIATVEVASDAHLALLTPDGHEPVAQAVLGAGLRLRVEDRDRDVSPEPDSISVTLAALPEADHPDGPDAHESAATHPASTPIPGDVSVPATQPQDTAKLPLAPVGMPSIVVKLTETGPHTGIFERNVKLDNDRLVVDGATLPLDQHHRLRVAYDDEKTISPPGGKVIVARLDCIPDRGGDIAAVKYRQTHLDLEAKLQRAVSAGEIGRIYLDLGLVERGRSYLANAESDCAEIAAAARASADPALGEESLYHSWQIYFYAGLLDDSVAAANRLMTEYPASSYIDQAMLEIGRVSVERGEKEAVAQKAAGHEPALNPDLRRAIEQLEELVKKYPSSAAAPEALFLEGRAHMAAGQTGLEAFERLAKRYPDSGFAAQGLETAARYYVGVGDYARAQEYLGRIVVDYPDSADLGQVLVDRGVCQFKLGQNAEALKTFYQVTEDHPGTKAAADAQRYVESLTQKQLP